MTPSPTWEKVEAPRGAYYGWGNRPPQVIIAKVLSFAINGGSDANGEPCPQLGLELIEATDNYRERGAVKERLNAGELVILNASQITLRRDVIFAAPRVGDLIKIEFTGTVKVQNGTAKNFEVQIARGAGGDAGSGPVTGSRLPPPAEPPF